MLKWSRWLTYVVSFFSLLMCSCVLVYKYVIFVELLCGHNCKDMYLSADVWWSMSVICREMKDAPYILNQYVGDFEFHDIIC